MKQAFLRIQTTNPSPPPNQVGLYVNSGGFLCTIASGGAPVAAGSSFTGAFNNTQIRTGTATFLNTGIWFGVAAGATLQTGLATPSTWIGINYSGTTYAIPAYSLA